MVTINSKNIRNIKTTNVEIARVIHKGGVIWSKIFYWKKYYIRGKTTIGYFPKTVTKEELASKYPNYINFDFTDTGYGTYEVSATTLEYVGIVANKNKNYYPDKGIKDGDYYRLIN